MRTMSNEEIRVYGLLYGQVVGLYTWMFRDLYLPVARL